MPEGSALDRLTITTDNEYKEMLPETLRHLLRGGKRMGMGEENLMRGIGGDADGARDE